MHNDSDSSHPLPAEASPAAQEPEQKLQTYIEALGAPSWLAKHLSQRLNRDFEHKAIALIQGFLRHGWSISELYWLDQWDTTWRQHPAHAFHIEKALVKLGFMPAVARRMVIERPALRILEVKAMTDIVAAMIDIGYTDIQLFNLSRSHAKFFRMTPQSFMAAYDKAQRDCKGILWNPKGTRQPPTIPPEKTVASSQPPVLSAEALAEIKTFLEPTQETPPEIIVSPQAVSIPVAPESKPVPIPQANNPPAEPKSSSVPVARIALKKIPSIPAAPRVPMIKTPVSVKREPLPAPYVPEETIKNWRELGKAILHSAFPNDRDRIWNKFLRENPWIDSKGHEARVLDQMYTWVSFGQTLPDKDPRALFFASILLNRNLPDQEREALRRQDKENLKRGQSSSRKRRQKKSAKPQPNLSSILKLDEEVVYFRMYVCRRILEEYDPQEHPEALCYPWEQVEPYAPPLPRNFSIPPPPLTDEKLWIAKRDELRYRVNYLRDLDWRPERKPFLFIIQEPTREKFLKRLERYLKDKNPEKNRSVKYRRNREIISPQSPLA